MPGARMSAHEAGIPDDEDVPYHIEVAQEAYKSEGNIVKGWLRAQHNMQWAFYDKPPTIIESVESARRVHDARTVVPTYVADAAKKSYRERMAVDVWFINSGRNLSYAATITHEYYTLQFKRIRDYLQVHRAAVTTSTFHSDDTKAQPVEIIYNFSSVSGHTVPPMALMEGETTAAENVTNAD